jgi:hypothetical protein
MIRATGTAWLIVALLLPWMVISVAAAHTATVREFVRDASDGQAMPEVNVSLSRGETLLGTRRKRRLLCRLAHPRGRLAAARHDVMLPYEPKVTRSAADPETWTVVLDLLKDRNALDTLINVQGTALVGVGMLVTVLDSAFVPPGAAFDPEVLIQPNVMTGERVRLRSATTRSAGSDTAPSKRRSDPLDFNS